MKKLIACFAFVAILFCNMTIISADELSGLSDFNGNLKVPEPVGTKVIYYDVPISKDLQEFIWDECYKNSISYELFLAICKTETDFQTDIVSETNDHGISQVNYHTFNYLNSKYFNGEMSIKNQKDRIKMSIFYLDLLRENWRNKYEGISEEDLFGLVVLSYHLGENGCAKFVKKYGFNSEYLNEVSEFKWMLEQGGDLNA